LSMICSRHEPERAGETVWAFVREGGNRPEVFCAVAGNSGGYGMAIGVTIF
jgi:hypothetical protein